MYRLKLSLPNSLATGATHQHINKIYDLYESLKIIPHL